MIDDPVAVYDILEVVLCATAVICSASSGQPSSARLGSFELLFFRPKEEGCHCAGNDSTEVLTDRPCATGSSGLFTRRPRSAGLSSGPFDGSERGRRGKRQEHTH